MKHKNSPWFIIGGMLSLLSASGLLLFFWYFGSALGQEKNTPDVLKAIVDMELSRRDVRAIASNPNRLLVRNFYTLRTHLEQQGWTWQDQFGPRVIYQQESQSLFADCHKYSRGYMICKLSKPA
jgi:hypothetical protein